jgi:O-antigen/teichoic acid export membrane protein
LETNQLVDNINTKESSGFENNISVVAKGGGITFIGKLFTNVIRLILAIVLARVLGTTQLGYYSLSLSAGNIAMGIALFGLDAAVIRFIAIMAARKDEEGTWEAIQIGIGVSLFLSTVMGVLLYAFSFYLSETVFNNPDLTPYLQLISVFVPLLVVNDQLFNSLRGFKQFNLSVLAQYIYQPITRLILVGILLVVGLNAKTAIISYGLATITASGAMFYFLNRQFPLTRSLKVTGKVLRDMFVFSYPVWLSGLLIKFQGNIQTIFIGSLNTISGVGIFSVASQITMVSGEFSSSINTTSKPIIAELHDKGDIVQMEKIYQLANKWVVIAQLPIFLIMVLFPQTILSIFGEDYTNGALALIILAVGSLLKVGTGMGGIIIDMAGYTKLKLMNSVIRLTIFIVLDLWLILKWGLVGAAIAVLGGEGIVNILRLVEVYFINKILPYNRSFFKPVLATIMAVAMVTLSGYYFPSGSSYLFAGINILVMVVSYIGIIFLLGFSEDELNLFNALISNIKNKFNKNTRGKKSV